MKKFLLRLLTGLMILTFLISNLFAQVTVTVDDAPSEVGLTFEMSFNSNVGVSLGQAGADQYWDFSNLDLPNTAFWEVIEAETSPFYPHFPETNLVYKVTRTTHDTVEYNYAKITNTDLTELGRGKIFGSDVTELIVPKRTTPKIFMPANFGDPVWSSVAELDTNYIGLTVTVVDSNYSTIDAWGTMKTSYGEFPCLRIRQDHFTDIYAAFGYLMTIERNINYFWIAKNYGIVATVTGMNGVTEPNYTQAKSVNVMTNFTTGICELRRSVVPEKFVLLQNYPNPFNPKTTFQYHLSNFSDVKLKVFNLAGQEVALLVNDNQQPGIYKIQWNAGNLPSGTYIYQIQMKGYVFSNKCLLVK